MESVTKETKPVLRIIKEPKTDLVETNTDALLSKEELESNLKKYDTLNKLNVSTINDENSFVIPGLKATKTLLDNKSGRFSMCTSMTPQGICVTEKYILISAYCHTHSHNSVLYMLDKNTHEFIKEIVLPGKPHAGNIAYDPVHNNIWVACVGKSFLTQNSTAYLNCVSLDKIEEYNFNESKEAIIFDKKYQIDGFKNASFISYYKNNIFVGNYYTDEWKDSYVVRFPIHKDGGLETKTVFGLTGEKEIAFGKEKAIIDKYCQGVYFDSGYCMIMRSSGKMHSLVQTYVGSAYQDDVEEMIELEQKHMEYLEHLDVLKNYPSLIEEKISMNEDVDSLKETLLYHQSFDLEFDEEAYEEKCKEEKVYSLENEYASRVFEFPARLEQSMISPYGDYKIYLLFESGAFAYRDQKSVDVVDRVLIIE